MKMLKNRFARTQYKVRLFVFIFISTRTFGFLVLTHGNAISETFALHHVHRKESAEGNSVTRTAVTGIEKTLFDTFETCFHSTEAEIKKELERFEANRNICVNHHTYLKKPESFVIEVGGYKGDDATMMLNTYNPRYVVLEPVEEYANIIREKFKSNSRVTVLTLGLGKVNEYVNISVKGNSSESGNNTTRNKTIEVKNATEFFTNIRVGRFDIDLLMMDCEGCELDVLESICESGLIKYFKNIQFKSHEHLPHAQQKLLDPKERYCKMQQFLSRTHTPTIQYKHIYENWRRNDLPRH